VIIY
jgi:hypothetical protein